jgi:malate synthase
MSLEIELTYRRKVAAMGGMSAQIPIKNDPAKNDTAMAKVRADKEREVTAGHDGTWVAHPALIKIAMDIFDEHMKGPNQVCRLSLRIKQHVADLVVPHPKRGCYCYG